MKENNLGLIGQLLRDFLMRSHCVKSVFRCSHFGWSRWCRVLDGKGTFDEYFIILTAIRMADRQHGDSLSEETECLTEEFFALYRSQTYEEMEAMIKALNPHCKHKE